MDGDAQQWYFRVERNQGVSSWARFTDLVSRRFGPPTRSNPLGELIKTQPTGTVAEYVDQFLRLLARCDGIIELQQIDIFTAGLGDPLRVDVELHRPVSLEDAMGLARSYEHRNYTPDSTTPVGRPSSHTAVHRSSSSSSAVTTAGSSASAPAVTPNAQLKPKATPSNRFTKLTQEEMVQRRDAASATTAPPSTHGNI
jgi:hypothetical protein